MSTTIQVSDLTKQRLGLLKEEFNVSSYDEVITQILKEKINVKTMFGSCKGIGPWTKGDRRSKYD